MAAEEKKDQKQTEEKTSQLKEKAQSEEEPTSPQPPTYRSEEEKTLFEWKAPARPFQPRDKKFWSTAISAAFIFGVILYIIEGVMPVFVIISFMFLYYVLTTVKPEEVEYKITTYGIRFADKLNEWPMLIRYWFTQRGDVHLLVIDTINLPGRFEMVINAKDKDKISDSLDEYLPEEEASPSGMERAADWLSRKMPDQRATSTPGK